MQREQRVLVQQRQNQFEAGVLASGQAASAVRQPQTCILYVIPTLRTSIMKRLECIYFDLYR